MKINPLNFIVKIAIINFFLILGFTVFQNQQISAKNTEQIVIAPTLTPTPVLAIEPTGTAVTATVSQKPTPVIVKETLAQKVAKHNSKSDCWMLISGQVYNITSYFGKHPGGDGIMLPYCGKDTTVAFNTKNTGNPHSGNAQTLLAQYLVK